MLQRKVAQVKGDGAAAEASEEGVSEERASLSRQGTGKGPEMRMHGRVVGLFGVLRRSLAVCGE